MANFVIWLDSEKANVFALKDTGVEKSHLKKTTADHHTRDPKDHMKDAGQEHFFKDLAKHITGGKEILLLGPGAAKTHFKTHLDNHHAGDLAKGIVGVETCDHPTDNQTLALARDFFKTYDQFNSGIKEVPSSL